jgi:uncharacterized protein (DUF4415 family)
MGIQMKRNKTDTKRARASSKAGKRVGKIEAAGSTRRPKYLPEEWEGMYKPVKKPVTLRLDADVLAWFQRGGRGYQTRINQALRKVMSEERKKPGK